MQNSGVRGLMRRLTVRLILSAVLVVGILSFITQIAGMLLEDQIAFGEYGVITDTLTGLTSTLETRGVWLSSPDGSYLLRGGPIFYVTNRSGKTNQMTRQAVIGTPSWSPDSRYLAFAGFYHRNADIYLYDPTVNASRELVVHPGDDTIPIWSPDSNQLYFTTKRNGSDEIFGVEIETGTLSQITNFTVGEVAPRVSPDGTRILYYDNHTGNAEIYVLNLIDNSRQNLTNHPAHDTDPAWDINGQRIFFTSDRNGIYGRYTMNPDGSNVTFAPLPTQTGDCGCAGG